MTRYATIIGTGRHVPETIHTNDMLKQQIDPDLARVVDSFQDSSGILARRLAPLLADHGHGLIDAPVSGGPAGAAAGALTFMVGGSAAHVARARPLLDALGKAVVHVGDSGAGNLAKLVNNLFCATHLVGVGEALRLTEALAVDPARRRIARSMCA